MENKSELNPIAQFLAESEKRLRGRLEPSVMAGKLKAARESMASRAEELTAGGLAPEAANATAAAAFGTPQQWTREILASENYRPSARPANTVSIVGFALCLMMVPMGTLALKNLATNQVDMAKAAFVIGLIVTPLAALAAPLGALIAGRSNVKALAGIAAAAAVLSALVIGTTAPLFENLMSQSASLVDLESNQKEQGLLQLGIQTYGASAAPATLPATLKTKDGYAAPAMTFHQERLRDIMSKISHGPVSENSVGSWTDSSMGMDYVATKALAAQRWRDFGAQRLAENEHARVEMQRQLMHGPAVAPARFSFGAARIAAFWVMLQGCWCLGICLVFSLIGRGIQQSQSARRLRTQTA
jgi:hypothetical protein